jgi:hypothetical protein
MTNKSIRDALTGTTPSIGAEVELLDHQLDEVSGGACQTFTCGVYRVV